LSEGEEGESRHAEHYRNLFEQAEAELQTRPAVPPPSGFWKPVVRLDFAGAGGDIPPATASHVEGRLAALRQDFPAA
jgi:hypothetical protein